MRKGIILPLVIMLMIFLPLSGFASHSSPSFEFHGILIKINGNAQLEQFVKEHTYPGNGTKENPYIISSLYADKFIMGNTSKYVIFKDFEGSDYGMHLFNVSNVKMLNLSIFECCGGASFVHVNNIEILDSSNINSHLTFNYARDVKFENVSILRDMSIENSKEINVRNSSLYEFTINNVSNLTLNSVKTGSGVWIKNSMEIFLQSIHLSSHGSLHLSDSNNVHIDSVIGVYGSFNEEWFTLENVLNASLHNVIIHGEFNIYGYRGQLSRDISVDNITLVGTMAINEAENIEISKAMVYSLWEEFPAIYMEKVSKINLHDITILRGYREGIYINEGENIKIYDSNISIDFVVKDEKSANLHHKSVGIFIQNSTKILIANSNFNFKERIGIELKNVSYATLKNNAFSSQVIMPIKIDGHVTHLLLQNNIRGVKSHPIIFSILLFIFIFIALLILAYYKRKKEIIHKSTIEFYKRLDGLDKNRK